MDWKFKSLSTLNVEKKKIHRYQTIKLSSFTCEKLKFSNISATSYINELERNKHIKIRHGRFFEVEIAKKQFRLSSNLLPGAKIFYAPTNKNCKI